MSNITSPRLSEDRLKFAFETFEWSKVEAVLNDAGGRHADCNAIAKALQRTNGLIFKYPHPPLEEKRRALFESLQSFLTRPAHLQATSNPVDEAIRLVLLAEAGYRKLVLSLNETDASKLEPTLHVSAALLRAEREIDSMMARAREGLNKSTDHAPESLIDAKE